MTPSLVIAVRARTDWHLRMVAALSAHERVLRVVAVGRKVPKNWGDGVVESRSVDGADVVIDPDPGDRGVHISLTGSGGGITNANSEGLAKSLAGRISAGQVAWTVPGEPVRAGDSYLFPAPVGIVRGNDHRAPIDGDMAAVSVSDGSTTFAVVDDRRFLDAVCGAAAALVAHPGPTTPTPVWDRAEEYLAACEELGIVIAST